LHVLTPGLLAGFGVVATILIGALVIGLANLIDLHDRSDAVAQTFTLRVALQRLLATMVDAETGERGFIITGSAAYLEPYDRARETIARDLARVRALVAGDGEQQADLEQLSAIVDLKLQELGAAIGERRNSGFAAAQAQVTTNVGKRTMDGIRAIVARMEARDDAALATRRTEAERSYNAARVTQLVTTLLALAAVIALFFGTVHYGDVRLKAARAAEAQRAQLQEALQQKDDFVALVSHELRNPVNTIAGWGRMLEAGTMSPDRSANAIAVIGRTANSLRALIDDLMDTTQLVSGRMRLTVVPLHIEEVVREAIDVVRLGAENKGVFITEIIGPDLPAIRGDAGRLKQVVCNLLANAVKFTPTGGHVTIAATAVDDAVRVEVHDTGEGIDPEFLPHVFERYRQGSASTPSRRGLGLGLSIVRHLVELHGGRVAVSSPGPGHGSTFVVHLPLAATSQPVASDRHLEPV
jgi:signal transduction histidine kinase